MRGSNASLGSVFLPCTTSYEGNIIYSTFTLSSLLLVPLYASVLFVGFRRGVRSHSDVFTFHMIAVELLCAAGAACYTAGLLRGSEPLLQLGISLSSPVLPGQTLFHCLTCAERYLAVVRPVTYLGLRERRGVRLRNGGAAAVWLVCAGWVGLTELYLPGFPLEPLLALMAASTAATSFCCVSALRALTQPEPGRGRPDRGRPDRARRRVFHAIAAIAGVLLLRSVGLLACFWSSTLLSVCWVMDVGVMLTLPSSLLLPLLFLNRAGKLAACRGGAE